MKKVLCLIVSLGLTACSGEVTPPKPAASIADTDASGTESTPYGESTPPTDPLPPLDGGVDGAAASGQDAAPVLPPLLDAGPAADPCDELMVCCNEQKECAEEHYACKDVALQRQPFTCSKVLAGYADIGGCAHDSKEPDFLPGFDGCPGWFGF